MEAGLFKTFTDVKFASRKKRKTDEDFIDRLNDYLTPRVMCLFSIIICAKQYVVGEPLQCWVPKEFSKHWESYAENYCWVQNTYFIPPSDQLPVLTNVRTDKEIGYYQWVPFVLAIQAGLFLLPAMIWKALNKISGMDIKSFVGMAIEASSVDPKGRDENIRMIARHIKTSLRQDWDSDLLDEDKHERLGIFKGIHGMFLSALYITVKILYIVNIIGQFFILRAFLGLSDKMSFYGIRILQDIISGRDWQESGHFPRVTMCDFEINALGQPRKYSLQCVLVINLFNEKIFIFLWFWFALLAIVTLFSLVSWLIWFLYPSWKQGTVLKCIQRLEEVSSRRTAFGEKGKDVEAIPMLPIGEEEDGGNFEANKRKLVNKILRSDGMFMLKMISNNAGEPIVFDIVRALWLDLTGVRSLKEEKEEPKEAKDPDASAQPDLNTPEDQNVGEPDDDHRSESSQ